MARYDLELGIGLEEALAEVNAKLSATVQRRLLNGADYTSILDDLIHDLDNNGPILGRFVRQLGGVAASSTLSAARQGAVVGHAAEDAALRRLLARAGVGGAEIRSIIEDADPELADAVEKAVEDDLEMVWVAVLNKTCHRCLPLHGTHRLMGEWRASGILPESIHDGWVSPCYCQLVPSEVAGRTSELTAPLRRVRAEKGQSKTKRDVVSTDVDKALRARDDARDTIEGRRMLRKLGQARREESEQP